MDLSTFEFIAGLGTVLVVVGVTSEFTEIFEKLAKAPLFRKWIKKEGSERCLFTFIWLARKLRPISLWIEGLGIGIVIVGLAIEWFGNSGAGRIQSDTNARLAYKTTELDSSNLNLSIELQRLKNPRIISNEQITNFILLTGSFPKKEIRVFYKDGRSETANYARQIREMLNAAGFKEESNSPEFGINPSSETILRKYPNDVRWPSLLIVGYSTNENITTEVYLETNGGFVLPYYVPDAVEPTANAFRVIFDEIHIQSEWHPDIIDNGIKPGEIQFFILDKP